MPQQVSTNKFSTAKWIVDTTGLDSGATHTTIAGALASAVSGEDIFVKPGIYTEDITLKAGVNIAAYAGDGHTPNVTILGKATATFAGTCSISGIRLETNGDFFLVVSGSSATDVNLFTCFFNSSDNTGISFTSSSSSSQIASYVCKGEIGTTGITHFASSSTGILLFEHCSLANSGNSTTASTASAGTIIFRNSRICLPITTSSTADIQGDFTDFFNKLLNTTAITHGGSGSNSNLEHCLVSSGTASAISIGTGATFNLRDCAVNCTNTNAITGIGTLIYANITIVDTNGDDFDTTTQIAGIVRNGIVRSEHQPAFLQGLTDNILNVTGDATGYVLVWDDDIFDQNSDFSSTTFTAPYDGRYHLSTFITYFGLSSSHTSGLLRIDTSNRLYISQTNPYANRGQSGSNLSTDKISILSDMDAADVSTVLVALIGGTKTGDIENSSKFSGELIC